MSYSFSVIGASTTTNNFSCNVSGAALLRMLLVKMKMGSTTDFPHFACTIKLTREMYDQADAYLDAMIAGADVPHPLLPVAEWVRHRMKWLSARSARGIALHKLCSNDGWWITADECADAVECYRKVTPSARHTILKSRQTGFKGTFEQFTDWFERFVGTIETGAKGRGVRVY